LIYIDKHATLTFVLSRPGTTAVIGGGASGALAALHLQRAAGPGRLVVVEPRADLGRGVAYGTTDTAHLLNVRAGRLGALPDEPGHFTSWAARRADVNDRSFLPRAWYGEYLSSLLGPVEHVRARAVDVIPLGSGLEVILSNGERLEVDRAVLAPGSSPPLWPVRLGGAGPRWIPDPWTRGALCGAPPADPILLVGTGLTAVDAALSLQATGRQVIATSRHGLLPESHSEQLEDPIRHLPPERPTARTLLAWASATAADAGDWALVADSIRSHANQLWEQMTESDRSRLLRHVHRRWEVLRHRMAPQVATGIRNMQETGQLAIVPGRITSARETRCGVDVVVGDQLLRVGAVVNCTGPTADVTRTRHGLVRRLLDRRIARPASLDLGLRTDARGCLPHTDDRLWLVGPLRRGGLWETTAIPEIRAQAAGLSVDLRELPELVAV
jgi:uncharacterized NAD(P)/FAD-binding protein YdhS